MTRYWIKNGENQDKKCCMCQNEPVWYSPLSVYAYCDRHFPDRTREMKEKLYQSQIEKKCKK